MCSARPLWDGLFLSPPHIMEDKTHTLGLTALLDEVSADLDELRKKHPGDYSTKNLTMWWDLERDRLLARHGPTSTVRKLRAVRGMKRMLAMFSAGWLVMIVVQTMIRFVMG
mgnify:CR=1 FL=1